jgi:hypothetical protein
MPAWLPVMAAFPVSLAVNDWTPAVFNVALNVPVPPLSVLLPGTDAWASLLLK